MQGLPEGEERPGRSVFRLIALGIAVSVALRLAVSQVAVESGEPLPLRWLRTLSEHPLRAALAASFAFVALRPRAPPP